MIKSILIRCRFYLELFFLVLCRSENFKSAVKSVSRGINPIGRVHFQFVSETTGVIRDGGWHPNLVVASGRDHIADRLALSTQPVMSHMAIGGGITPATAADVALVSEIARVGLTRSRGTGTAGNRVTYSCTFPSGVGTGVFTEAGIFNAASGGTMLCRTVFGAKTKNSDEQVQLFWYVTIPY